jgi:hypothetical protein
MTRLTKKQERLVSELDEILALLGADYDRIEEAAPGARTAYLESVKDQHIRGAVVLSYVLIDEYLNDVICQYYFGKQRTFQQLWKTKRFTNFNHYVLENLYVVKKLELAREILDIPRDVVRAIYAINDLRNALAHTFFPQNLRRNRTQYRGSDIYKLEGFRLFLEDRERIVSFFMKKIFGIAF